MEMNIDSKGNYTKFSYPYGLLCLRCKSFLSNGLMLNTDVSQRNMNIDSLSQYQPINIDEILGDYDIVVFPGTTLEHYTAGYYSATSYNDNFAEEEHIYTHFELEAPNSIELNARKILDGSNMYIIPEEYLKPLPIINDYSQSTYTNRKQKRFDFFQDTKKIGDTVKGIVELPVFLFKVGVLKKDSDSEQSD